MGGLSREAILDEADAFKEDLIVLGLYGRGRIERFLLGSVSLAVVTHATCSVEIVRRPTAKVLVRRHCLSVVLQSVNNHVQANRDAQQ